MLADFIQINYNDILTLSLSSGIHVTKLECHTGSHDQYICFNLMLKYPSNFEIIIK